MKRWGAVALLVCVACGSGEDASAPDDASTGGTLPACTWPSSLSPDASPGQTCTADRTMLECKEPNGSGAGCLSDGVTPCPLTSAEASCERLCNDDEYGVFCSATPPGNCRALPPPPGGDLPYCCACE
ncbi:MAG: hypothetical protein KC776_12235 [Myxococcales bacterium]|nr:hypothetical protein [Myxococcales bacterium]MCB9577337.1 hypothetical protein [Polyangiaceae bacterium]